MRIDFKPKSQEEVFSILLFYWAYFWRVFLWAVFIFLFIIVGLMLCIIAFTQGTSLLFLFYPLLILPFMVFLVIIISLYTLRKLTSKKFKTFSVKWLIPEPKSIWTREYLKKVLVYLGVSMSAVFIFGAFYAFGFILDAFLFYVFAKNEWLPFLIEPKTKDTNQSLEVH